VFSGAPADLTELARGRVWIADARSDRAEIVWRTADGRHRHVGGAVRGELVEPTLEDGYLLLLGEESWREAA
jgi:ABC-2 type transport system ATP-binding protein